VWVGRPDDHGLDGREAGQGDGSGAVAQWTIAPGSAAYKAQLVWSAVGKQREGGEGGGSVW
jgi:hypothetical protein